MSQTGSESSTSTYLHFGSHAERLGLPELASLFRCWARRTRAPVDQVHVDQIREFSNLYAGAVPFDSNAVLAFAMDTVEWSSHSSSDSDYSVISESECDELRTEQKNLVDDNDDDNEIQVLEVFTVTSHKFESESNVRNEEFDPTVRKETLQETVFEPTIKCESNAEEFDSSVKKKKLQETVFKPTIKCESNAEDSYPTKELQEIVFDPTIETESNAEEFDPTAKMLQDTFLEAFIESESSIPIESEPNIQIDSEPNVQIDSEPNDKFHADFESSHKEFRKRLNTLRGKIGILAQLNLQAIKEIDTAFQEVGVCAKELIWLRRMQFESALCDKFNKFCGKQVEHEPKQPEFRKPTFEPESNGGIELESSNVPSGEDCQNRPSRPSSSYSSKSNSKQRKSKQISRLKRFKLLLLLSSFLILAFALFLFFHNNFSNQEVGVAKEILTDQIEPVNSFEKADSNLEKEEEEVPGPQMTFYLYHVCKSATVVNDRYAEKQEVPQEPEQALPADGAHTPTGSSEPSGFVLLLGKQLLCTIQLALRSTVELFRMCILLAAICVLLLIAIAALLLFLLCLLPLALSL